MYHKPTNASVEQSPHVYEHRAAELSVTEGINRGTMENFLAIFELQPDKISLMERPNSSINVSYQNTYSRMFIHGSIIWNSLWEPPCALGWSVTHPAIWFLLFYLLLLDQSQALDSILQTSLIQGPKSGDFFLLNSYY